MDRLRFNERANCGMECKLQINFSHTRAQFYSFLFVVFVVRTTKGISQVIKYLYIIKLFQININLIILVTSMI